MAVLEQSLAVREAGRAGLSLALLDRARAAGIGSGWLQDNRARALVVLGRCDVALAIWAELREQETDPALVACAEAAQRSLQWPPQLVQALERANLIEADQCLAQWFSALGDGSSLGLRELCHVVDQQPRMFARVVPLLERQQHHWWRLPRNCCAVCSNVALSLHRWLFSTQCNQLFCCGLPCGCRPRRSDCARSGLWCPVSTDDLVFPRGTVPAM